MRATLLPILLLLALAALLAGCGSDDPGTAGDERADSAETSGDSPGAPAQHLDGTVKVEGESIVLTPEGRAPMTLDLGEDVAIAQVRALEASGAVARVTFEPATGERNGLAIDVRETPRQQAGTDAFSGTVVEVDAKQITIKGDSGTRTFAMGIADAHEVEHLQEHADSGSPVKVFLDDAGSDAGAAVVAYEDA